MALENIKRKAQEIVANQGRAYLHSIAPDDFEYYACTLVLEDGSYNTLQVFNFPVMPNSMSINKRPLVNIKKTARGYLSQFSTSFSGDTISINGTFGRKFRLLLTDEIKKPNFKNPDVPDSEKIFYKDIFDAKVKTGYGSLKLMEKILYMSTQQDEQGYPHRLYFLNYAFNEMFLVEPINWSKQQSLENNAMWNYSLELKCLGIAKTKYMGGNKGAKLTSLLGTAAVQKSFNNTFNNLTFGGAADVLRGDI